MILQFLFDTHVHVFGEKRGFAGLGLEVQRCCSGFLRPPGFVSFSLLVVLMPCALAAAKGVRTSEGGFSTVALLGFRV